MIHSAIVRIVEFCARHRWTIVISGTLLALGAVAFDVARFSINTDIEGLISQDLPWQILGNQTLYRSEEHTSEVQSHLNLVCRLLLEKKKSTRRHRPPAQLTI